MKNWPDRSRLDEIQVDWLPIGSGAPGDVLNIAKNMLPPEPGEHVCKVATLPDGRVLVLKFSNPGVKPESYFILPKTR